MIVTMRQVHINPIMHAKQQNNGTIVQIKHKLIKHLFQAIFTNEVSYYLLVKLFMVFCIINVLYYVLHIYALEDQTLMKCQIRLFTDH